jgi:hypothetical protein
VLSSLKLFNKYVCSRAPEHFPVSYILVATICLHSDQKYFCENAIIESEWTKVQRDWHGEKQTTRRSKDFLGSEAMKRWSGETMRQGSYHNIGAVRQVDNGGVKIGFSLGPMTWTSSIDCETGEMKANGGK